MRKNVYFIILTMFLIDLGISGINFKEHIIGENLNFTMSVISCDLDKDGDKDILGAAYIADGVKWWENDGNQNFTEHIIGKNYGSTRTIFAADVNRDGYMDVLSAGADSGKVTWWENDGNQNFTGHTVSNSFEGAHTVSAYDVDSDGDVDILGASFTRAQTGKLCWWENDGRQNFTEHILSNKLSSCVYAADIDSDGDLDILGSMYMDSEIIWWQNNGNKSFKEINISETFRNPHWARAKDVDQDGNMDIIASGCGRAVAWWRNDGNENFTEHMLSDNFLCASSIYSADVDGDGDNDILSTSENYHDIRWWENDGAEKFTEHTVSGLFAGASDVYVDDVDGDGDMDVLGAGNRANQIVWWENAGKTPITFQDDPTEKRFFTILRTHGVTNALKIYKQMKDQNPELHLVQAANINNLALEFVQERNFEDAELLYNLAISENQDCVPAFMGLAELYLEKNEGDKAKSFYQKALNAGPDKIEIHDKLKIALMLNDEELFNTIAEDLIKNNQKKYQLQENVLNMMGYVFMQRQMLDKSLKVWCLNIDLYPQSANVYDSYGEGLMNNGQVEEAITNYKKSLELFPQNGNAVKMLKKLQKEPKTFPKLKGEYLGQNLPGNTPELFAPGIISTEFHDDAAPLFSPDGKEVYFRIVWKKDDQYYGTWFVMKMQEDGIWTEPEVAPFSGMQLDGSAVFSADGSRIYFNSGRPENINDTVKDQNIWYVEKSEQGWTEPIIFDEKINSEKDDMISCISRTGDLYFDVEDNENGFQVNSFCAKYDDGNYKEVHKIENELVAVDGCRFTIAPDESYMIQTAFEKGKSLDLFISFKNYDGTWSKPQNMGDKINSTWPDKFSGLSPDGKFLFFVSKREHENSNLQKTWETDFFIGNQMQGGGDVFWVSTDVISDLKMNYINRNAEYKIDWQKKSDMPEARRNLKIIADKNRIYALGGYAQPHKGREKGNFCYDIKNDFWTAKMDMITGRSNFAIASVKGKIYAIGGDKFLDDAEIYDPANDVWKSITPMFTARQHINCAVIDNKIYVIGGRTLWNKDKPNEGVVSVHEVYDIENNSWKTLKPFPTKVENLSLSTVDKKLYAINGYDRTLRVYLPEKNDWIDLTGMPDSYFIAGTTVINNKIFVLDGVRPGEKFSRIYVYEPETDQWKTATSLPASIKLAGFTSVNNQLYVIGGCNHGFTANNYTFVGEICK